MNVQIPAVVKVGIADVQLVKTPDRIRTSGLGSCVGLVLFDQEKNWQDLSMSCFQTPLFQKER